MSRVNQRLYCLRYWCGLPFYLPKLSREVQTSRRLMKYSIMLALLACLVPFGLVGAIAIAVVASALVGLASFWRSWAIWDLLVWDRDRWSDAPDTRPAQGPNSEAAIETMSAILERNPLRIRSAVARVIEPTAWRTAFGRYALALADVMDRRPPDIDGLEAVVGQLQTDVEREKGAVMVALVRASEADIAGGDWRMALLQCRRELRPPFAPLRWIWPCQLSLYVMAYLLVLALVLLTILATVRF